MGCTHDGNQFEIDTTTADDPFNGTVMSPLIPNPNSTTYSRPKNTITTTTTTISSTTPPYYSFIQTNNLSPLNQHLGNIATEQSRTEFIEQPLGSSRWNPTPEQLLALEEMYRLGMRTPSAEQIQQIATQLRRFGKIEGKNVFYWFQNHKARERQKRRREIESNSEEKHHETDGYLEKKEYAGLRKGTSYDVEPTKNWASSSNWSKHSEEFVSMHRSVSMAETGPHGWTQFDDRELQLQRKMISTNCCTVDNINATTWQTLECLPSSPNHIKLMPHMFKSTNSSDIKLLNNHQNLNSSSSSSSLMFKPYQENFNSFVVDDENEETTQTLELFPLHSDDHNSAEATKKDNIKVPIKTINNTNFNPNQYIEFLPLKN